MINEIAENNNAGVVNDKAFIIVVLLIERLKLRYE
tara:strand:+ start:21842 stop:21946 length:105 start_codon:yes stop_codon:yes gene_type:complete